MIKFNRFGSLLFFAFSLLSLRSEAQTEAAAPPQVGLNEYQFCGPSGCEVQKIPSSLGAIRQVQLWPIIKNARASALVSGSSGYAICALPQSQGKLKCIGIRVPVISGARYSFFERRDGSYGVGLTMRGDAAAIPAYQALQRTFNSEFDRSRDLLDIRIQEQNVTIGLTTSRRVNRVDSMSARVFRSGMECSAGEGDNPDQCPPVKVEGPGGSGDDSCTACDAGGPPPSDSDEQGGGDEVETPPADACSSGAGSGPHCPDPQTARLKCLDESWVLYLEEIEDCKRRFPGENAEMAGKRATCYALSSFEYGERNNVCRLIN